MKHFRIRKRDKVSEGAHAFRGCVGALIVLLALGTAFWKWGPKDTSVAQAPIKPVAVKTETITTPPVKAAQTPPPAKPDKKDGKTAKAKLAQP